MALAGTVAIFALAPAAGPALGLDTSGIDSVSVPQLQTSTQLPQTPDASVPVPEVPQVQTPSVPSTPQVNVPSVSTPQASGPSAGGPAGGQSSQSTTGSPAGAAAPASQASGSRASRQGAAARRSASASGVTPQARARRQRAHERQLRAAVRRFSGCLGSLPGTERRFLSLRAGLSGPPLSRARAARSVGIPPAEAGAIERRGLRRLSNGCAANSGSAAAHAAAQAVGSASADMPVFQPVPLLAAAGSGAPPQAFVDHGAAASGAQQVAGVSARSGLDEPSQKVTIAAQQAAATSGGMNPDLVALLTALTLMAVAAVLALRRRLAHHADAALALTPDSRVPLAPQRPQVEPVPRQAATRTRPAARTRVRGHRRVAPGPVIASGVLSLAARELVRRRRAGRRP